MYMITPRIIKSQLGKHACTSVFHWALIDFDRLRACFVLIAAGCDTPSVVDLKFHTEDVWMFNGLPHEAHYFVYA